MDEIRRLLEGRREAFLKDLETTTNSTYIIGRLNEIDRVLDDIYNIERGTSRARGPAHHDPPSGNTRHLIRKREEAP